MTHTRQLFFALLLFAAFALTTASSVKADPLFFGNVLAGEGFTPTVDLFANPGITLTGPRLSFRVDVLGTGADTLQFTFAKFSGTSITPAPALLSVTGGGDAGGSPLFTGSFTGTLTLGLLGSSPDYIVPGGPNAGQRVDSYTFSFNVVDPQAPAPVPEPATLLLLGSGLAGITASLRNRKRRAKKTKRTGGGEDP